MEKPCSQTQWKEPSVFRHSPWGPQRPGRSHSLISGIEKSSKYVNFFFLWFYMIADIQQANLLQNGWTHILWHNCTLCTYTRPQLGLFKERNYFSWIIWISQCSTIFSLPKKYFHFHRFDLNIYIYIFLKTHWKLEEHANNSSEK